jgi:prephenate dehydrogenase
MELHEARVAVVGLGLMGGSLAAALRAHEVCREVVGVARRQTSITTALTLRMIHRGTTDLREGVTGADLVVLCTPVGDILTRLAEIGPWLKPGCIVLDVGSTKAEICRAMERLPEGIQPVGGHPMCGKESSGLAMAEPSLYLDKVFVLAPLQRTAPEAVDLAEALVRAIGARPLYLEPERHDRIVAAISHLPYLLAVTLVNAAERLSQRDGDAGDDLFWALAATGFGDTSRVAASSIPMMTDIMRTNRAAILEAVRTAQAELAQVAELLHDNDVDALLPLFGAARERRRGMNR